MFHIVIPARFGSTRLPGKALLPIADKPMVAWVWERAMQAGAEHVVVATDDERIADEMSSRGAEVAMTCADHASGTDRLAEVVEQRGWREDAIVVNVQGDEPEIDPHVIDRLIERLEHHPEAEMATLAAPIPDDARFLDPACVKVVTDISGRALYFSRAPIPFRRDASESPARRPLMHLGIYAYRREALLRFAALPPSGIS